MAKRGRPSKKVMKKRKELKRKSQSLLIIAVGGLILFIALSYYYPFIKNTIIFYQ